jgi:hypothetical protein
MTLSAVAVRRSRRLNREDASARRSSHRANKGVFKDKFTIDHTASLHKRKRVRKRKDGTDGTPSTSTSSMQNAAVKVEASIPTEDVSDDEPYWKRIVKVRRKAAKRSFPFELTEEELDLVSQEEDEDIPARKKPRLEEPPPRRWTLEEDAKLTRAVAHTSKRKRGKEYKTNWTAISELFPGRTRIQCWNRWNDVLDPTIGQTSGRKGSRWTAVQDSKLKDAVQTHGDMDWVAISLLVPGRTRKQCKERWHSTLNPSIALMAGRKGIKWTAVEDSKLKVAVQRHGDKDWVAISLLVPGRTKKQCSYRWHDTLNPSIALMAGRTGKWTAVEDSKLKVAIQRHGDKDWVAISLLVPGRTRKQCSYRWHCAMNPSIALMAGRKGFKWTVDEDRQLNEAVRKHGDKDQTNGDKDWVAISAMVPGRTRKQCNRRWHTTFNPSIALTGGSKGKWAEDEDSKLKYAVQTHGDNDWVAISEMVPGRTGIQCKSRWHYVLDPNLGRANGRTGKWTAVEDSKLKDAVQTHGDKEWGVISALVPGRTKNQCNHRWRSVLDPGIIRASRRKTGSR